MSINQVRRIFVEKKTGFGIEAGEIFSDLKENLNLSGLTCVRVLNRYDVTGVTKEEFNQAVSAVFSEPPLDIVYEEELPLESNDWAFAIEYLPGQYDQRADSAEQCIEILLQKNRETRPIIHTAKIIILKGNITDDQFQKVKKYLINPVEAREASFLKPSSLKVAVEYPQDVPILNGFNQMPPERLKEFLQEQGLAMSYEDLVFCQEYFKNTEKRDPTITEIKVIDTYWSDHCRHTTFFTEITEVGIEPGKYTQTLEKSYKEYRLSREYVYPDKPKAVSLMDIATMAMKDLKKQGLLGDLDESDEINACSLKTIIDVDGKKEEWLIMFKNETHNHPTEIEPFGGAATCLGGCIRDPLSGRSYVYQAMRVTGSADPRASVETTLPGKLPQRKITIGAAKGYSSYGNQIGLATGQVAEIYDQGFIAKRMEIGAVVAAAPKENVIRSAPLPGDVVILTGGRTGRDGCGGATGSSKEHTETSLDECEAEVQKGNPVTERKIQRLFRDSKVSSLIKRCNDFGAGGVSVAIGELTEGVVVNLDAIPKKYEGLNGTELAISESQERMAVVVSQDKAADFINYASLENLEATIVANVTGDRRLKMLWREKTIVNLSRDFLDTNGVKQYTKVTVTAPPESPAHQAFYPEVMRQPLYKSFEQNAADLNLKKIWLDNLADLNICSQKGLVENFDSSIGKGTVLMPFGGKYQDTPAEGMAAKVPVLTGKTNTGTIMTYGYNPAIFKWSPFHGAVYSVVEAVAKVVALGGDYKKIRLTLQEYFEKLGQDSQKWGKPFSALLGAYYAQKRLNVPAIGGKDSMSGTFKDLNVPPVLATFAATVFDVRNTVSQEFKQPQSQVVVVKAPKDDENLPDFSALTCNFEKVQDLIKSGKVLAAHTVRYGGIAAALSKMCFGNRLGFEFTVFDGDLSAYSGLFAAEYGSFILEMPVGEDLAAIFGSTPYTLLGETIREPVIKINAATVITLDDALASWRQPLEKIFPTVPKDAGLACDNPPNFRYDKRNCTRAAVRVARPRVFIPVFPGTNCEYDSAAVFEKAGALADTLVIKNISPQYIRESIQEMVKRINNSQIIMLPGGFSAGDEPDGAGKFIAVMLRNPFIKEAITGFLNNRDGLMLGICNGFQALIKLGLVPYGQITEMSADSPTLTYNKIGRHISCMVKTKVTSILSPWMSLLDIGEVYTIPASHGEGRFHADAATVNELASKGQIAAQYVDFDGNATYATEHNPNGSFFAIESITSPDGRILGKMAHSERIDDNVAVNIPGSKDQRIFASGVNYFR